MTTKTTAPLIPFMITVRFAQHEREVYVDATDEAAAVAAVRATLTGQEARWAAVFAG